MSVLVSLERRPRRQRRRLLGPLQGLRQRSPVLYRPVSYQSYALEPDAYSQHQVNHSTKSKMVMSAGRSSAHTGRSLLPTCRSLSALLRLSVVLTGYVKLYLEPKHRYQLWEPLRGLLRMRRCARDPNNSFKHHQHYNNGHILWSIPDSIGDHINL